MTGGAYTAATVTWRFTLPALSVCVSNLRRCGIGVIVSVKYFVSGQERDGGLHDSLGHINKGERLRGFLGEDLEALLHRGDFVRMIASQVVLFVRIFGEVVELDIGRKYRSPD